MITRAGVAPRNSDGVRADGAGAANEPPCDEPVPRVSEYAAAGVVGKALTLDKIRVNVVEASVATRGRKESSRATINIPVPSNHLGLRGGITGQLAQASASAGGGGSNAGAEMANRNGVLQGPVNRGLGAVLLRSAAQVGATHRPALPRWAARTPASRAIPVGPAPRWAHTAIGDP